MEFLHSFLRRHFAVKPVLASRKCRLFSQANCHKTNIYPYQFWVNIFSYLKRFVKIKDKAKRYKSEVCKKFQRRSQPIDFLCFHAQSCRTCLWVCDEVDALIKAENPRRDIGSVAFFFIQRKRDLKTKNEFAGISKFCL